MCVCVCACVCVCVCVCAAAIRDQTSSVAAYAAMRGGAEAETLAWEALADIYLLSECVGGLLYNGDNKNKIK